MGKGTPGQGREKLSLPARTSKTGKKLVFLPEDVQSRPIPNHPGITNVTPAVAPPKHDGASQDEERGDERSEAERMSKEERERGGFGRLTAYGMSRELLWVLYEAICHVLIVSVPPQLLPNHIDSSTSTCLRGDLISTC